MEQIKNSNPLADESKPVIIENEGIGQIRSQIDNLTTQIEKVSKYVTDLETRLETVLRPRENPNKTPIWGQRSAEISAPLARNLSEKADSLKHIQVHLESMLDHLAL